MNLKTSIEQAKIILGEEEKRPTLQYRYVSASWPEELRFQESQLKSQGRNAATAGKLALIQSRERARPREVHENARDWVFESTNYALLMAIFGQIGDEARPLFVNRLLSLTVEKLVPQHNTNAAPFPAWSGYCTALPLVAEFCVRNNFLKALIEGLSKVKLPNPSIAGMFREFEEMISVNFDLFSDSELQAMPLLLKPIREMASLQTWSSRQDRGGTNRIRNPHYREGLSGVAREIIYSIDAFLKQCEQARYFYLKGVLQQTRSPEVERDKKEVEDYLSKLGFGDLMIASLNAAEQDMRSTASPFELKSALGHLRSFLEQLHLQACELIVHPSETAPDKWGAATIFLRHRDVITPKEEEFITKLYTLISDEGIHPLIAEREYARLFRNIMIEYGLLFLTTLQKKNLHIGAANP